MKLIIQIPCYNEEKTLPIALAELPRRVEGFSEVEWLVINDGSTDNTVEVARQCGVDHVISFKRNSGLAHVFMAGINEAIAKGADVIVNTDADNQYCADDIPLLVAPILEGRADIVVGARPISKIRHFSPLKKLLQKIGSGVVRMASNTDIPDAPSGFRAMTRDAALKMNVFNHYTYTLETIIQAGLRNVAITWVPVRTNEELRPSRLMKSMYGYIKKSIITIFRIYIIYEPFKFFARLGIFSVIAGLISGGWYLYNFIVGEGKGHIQSVMFSGVCILLGFLLLITALIVDLFSVNRRILEDIQYRVRLLESSHGGGAGAFAGGAAQKSRRTAASTSASPAKGNDSGAASGAAVKKRGSAKQSSKR